MKSKLTEIWNWFFNPSKHERDPLPPAVTFAEWRMMFWHRMGTRLRAHAYGLEAYHATYAANNVDEWRPESAKEKELAYAPTQQVA